jgi:hypothetical protein
MEKKELYFESLISEDGNNLPRKKGADIWNGPYLICLIGEMG